MGLINRFVLVVRPREPFLEWVNSREWKDESVYTLEEIRKDPSAYLIPDTFFTGDAIKWVYQEYDYFFDDQLEAWWTDERGWPKSRTLEMFKEWFDLEIFPGVDDAVEGPIEEDLG